MVPMGVIAFLVSTVHDGGLLVLGAVMLVTYTFGLVLIPLILLPVFWLMGWRGTASLGSGLLSAGLFSVAEGDKALLACGVLNLILIPLAVVLWREIRFM